MDEAKQIENFAESVLPANEYQLFASEFRELQRVPMVHNWLVRSIRIFQGILDCDQLTKRLFTFLLAGDGRINWNLSFLESAYLRLESGAFRCFFATMLEFAALRRDQEERQIVGNCLLEILRISETRHRSQCEESNIAFSPRFYVKFGFLLELYIKFDLDQFEQIAGVINEYTNQKGSPTNEYEIQLLRNKALEVFGTNENLTNKLLNCCTWDQMRSGLVAPVAQNYVASGIQTSINPLQYPMYKDGQGIQNTQGLNFSPTFSVTRVRRQSPVHTSTLSIPTNDLVGNNHPVCNISTPYNPRPDLATSVGHGQSFGQGFWIPNPPTPVSAFPSYNYPAPHNSTVDNQYGKYYPAPALWTPGNRIPATSVHRQTSEDSTTSGSSFSV